MYNFMPFYIYFSIERLRANVTFEWLYASMSSFMSQHIWWLAERFITYIANVRFRPGMGRKMFPQVGFAEKLRATFVTTICFHVLVNEFMIRKAWWPLQYFSTVFACIRPMNTLFWHVSPRLLCLFLHCWHTIPWFRCQPLIHWREFSQGSKNPFAWQPRIDCSAIWTFIVYLWIVSDNLRVPDIFCSILFNMVTFWLHQCFHPTAKIFMEII